MRCALVMVLVACGSREAPPSSGSAVASGSAVGRADVVGSSDAVGSADAGASSTVPAGPMPVALPSASRMTAIDKAASFVVIDKAGAITFGPLRPGATPYAGFEARDGLDSSLDAIAPPQVLFPDENGAASGSVPSVGGGGGGGYAPPRPEAGLLIRGVAAPAIDTLVLADRDVDAGIVTDTIAGLSTTRIVGLGVTSSSSAMRFELAFRSRAPRTFGEVGSGVAFVVSAGGVTWWISHPDGRSEVVEHAWSNDARGKLLVWANEQRSLAKAYVAIEGGTRLSHLMTALEVLGEAGATDIELGRRWAIDKDGNIVNYRRPPLRTEAKLSSANEADQKSLLRTFKQRTPQMWTCMDKGRDTKPNLAGTIDSQFVIHDGTPATITAKGIEATVDACIADVIREMRFGMAGDVTVDVKIAFPKG